MFELTIVVCLAAVSLCVYAFICEAIDAYDQRRSDRERMLRDVEWGKSRRK